MKSLWWLPFGVFLLRVLWPLPACDSLLIGDWLSLSLGIQGPSWRGWDLGWSAIGATSWYGMMIAFSVASTFDGAESSHG